MIREALDDLRHGQRVPVSTAKGTAKASAGITAGTILSIGVGGAIIYYGHDYQEAVAVGLFIAIIGGLFTAAGKEPEDDCDQCS